LKEECNKDLESLWKKNQTEICLICVSNSNKPPIQIKNTGEIHSSRLEQVEDRISRLKDKININGKKTKNS
jgi:hypothetical protein